MVAAAVEEDTVVDGTEAPLFSFKITCEQVPKINFIKDLRIQKSK